jgi:trehalose 6-phosphate synthase
MGNGLVVASNRGPVTWRRDGDGGLEAHRGAGGLVTALGAALEDETGTWVSVALSDGDRAVAAEHPDSSFKVEVAGVSHRLRLLDAGDRFDAYYNEVSNRLLWFTVHGLWGEPYEPAGLGWSEAWEDGYLPVNQAVAEAVVGEAAGDAEIYLQDYHLAVTAETVRDALPSAKVLHYIHTPWPGPGYLRRLPDPITEGLLRGLLAADVVAFSSPAWARSFRYCASDLLDAHVDGETVRLGDRQCVVGDFVLGVDEEGLAAAAASPAVARAGEKLDSELDGRQLLVRADRTDLSKNILRGLRAYEVLLGQYPEHRGRVWHYAHLNPSRQGVAEYRDYLQACLDVAAGIQERFGEESLTLTVSDDYPSVVAALQRSDVLLANPVTDGTNLVAKEGPVLNRRDGVVVLARTAGAAYALGDAALQVNPYDVEGTAHALHQALTMDPAARAARAAALHDAARLGAPHEWFAAQRHLLRAAAARRR